MGNFGGVGWEGIEEIGIRNTWFPLLFKEGLGVVIPEGGSYINPLPFSPSGLRRAQPTPPL
ncbi:TPA: hypothetical protein DDY56_03745 [Candidatus Uhrbacteria bacterium]|nr:MAG: hypothetical protein UU63_C0059G0005 [Candidatus Uhrbacteria bacterium GW2011_GWF2_41_430]OGL94188.1 MAG: hypothetical protein A2258_02420 [Candidatus Uhrbacteria bacterium RIFOXYA2_FULL_41_8]OGL96254.1 MAG: hypothetical protein A2317_02125 [Candidatus Uhrbacteria bacterium RIFOXYB2_FULL_41_10]HAL50416.1 hypothetical protein [Candidatus Uhrbacteria bacterium]HAN06702.1 hypothetical protein [Candidatus Uhrbacteria bacterium]